MLKHKTHSLSTYQCESCLAAMQCHCTVLPVPLRSRESAEAVALLRADELLILTAGGRCQFRRASEPQNKAVGTPRARADERGRAG